MVLTTSRPVRAARRHAHEVSQGLVWLGRVGLAAIGVVYALIGFVAARVAAGAGDEAIDSHGALGRITQLPFGSLLLAVVTIGLAGYALWRIVEAIRDPEGHGTDAKGLLTRGTYLLSAAVYGGLAITAIRLLIGASGDSGNAEGATQDWTGRVLEQPFGPWLVALVGAGLVCSAGYQLAHAVTGDFCEQLRTDTMTKTEERVAVGAGRLGHLARGVTFGIIGLFLVLAAFRQDPGEAKGLAGALNTLASQPYGPEILGVVAVGLVCYGLYQLVEARYGRIVSP